VIRAGDLVVPIDELEFLFLTPSMADDENDPIEIAWNDNSIGIVAETLTHNSQRDYYHVRIVVGEVIGWTFSDYIRVIHRNKT